MIQAGSQVTIHYTLTVDGDVVDSSSGGEPLAYVQGSGQIIPGLEEQLAELGPGDKRRLVIPPEKAYGRVDPAAFAKVPKQAFQNPGEVEVGGVVSGSRDGEPFRAVVSEVGDQDVTLDLNHPLAGKTLQFDVEVVEVRTPSA